MIPQRLFRFLLGCSRRSVAAMLVAGIASGLLGAAVLALVGRAVHRVDTPLGWLAAGFAIAVLGKIVATIASQLVSVRFAQDRILELSLELCERILATPLRTLERHGRARLLTTLTDDVSWVTWAVQALPQFAVNAAVILGCGAYLAWLSAPVFAGVVGITLVGALGYQWLHRRAFGVIEAAREARVNLFECFTELSDGAKELMMSRERRAVYLSHAVRGAAADYRRHNLAATHRYALADAWTQALFFGLIGALLFAFPTLAALSPEALTGYVIALLYAMGPVWSVIQAVPTLTRGQVALERIEALGGTLAARSATQLIDQAPVLHAPSIELDKVTFRYADSGFALGPIDLRLDPGELVFVVGGNGSGKSTFVKLLTGLYAPDSGAIRIAGTPIDERRRAWYREHFAVVFADFHLFADLHGLAGPSLASRAAEYLRLLEVDHKVALVDGAYSTTALSSGQRKRLALVTALLEDRPCYVFDEWAADQDPTYKEIFYTRLLPQLRAAGKAVIVITHDDRYFHLGDRVLKLEDGRPASGWSDTTRIHAIR